MKLHRRPIVLLVDDIESNLRLLQAYLKDVDCDVVLSSSGERAIEQLPRDVPDLVLLDVNMPGLDGFEVCRHIKEEAATKLVPVVMITALDRSEDRVRALEAGADDFMTKPVDRVELVARVRSALKLKAVYDTLESAEHVIFSLASAVEAKDSYTEAHTERVARAARQLGERLGLGDPELDALFRGGMVHDIGKIGIPDAILLKPGPLNRTETLIMRDHPVIGERIVRPLKSSGRLLPIIRHHHERFDGRGYPDGLRGQDIPLLARIVAVCDAHDALISDRPYRKGLSVGEAKQILCDGGGTEWDPELVEVATSGAVTATASGAGQAAAI
jgi:putative two-component system response regulator